MATTIQHGRGADAKGSGQWTDASTRGDDAIGPMAADCWYGVFHSMLGLTGDWRGYDSVVLIGAAALPTDPGTIHGIDLPRDPLPADVGPASTHAFRRRRRTACCFAGSV